LLLHQTHPWVALAGHQVDLVDAELAPPLFYRGRVVDDNHDAAESLALLLCLSGPQTRTAFDGLEAIQAAQAWHPRMCRCCWTSACPS
jgi:hypothetical protein